jgi:hypothetical protein
MTTAKQVATTLQQQTAAYRELSSSLSVDEASSVSWSPSPGSESNLPLTQGPAGAGLLCPFPRSSRHPYPSPPPWPRPLLHRCYRPFDLATGVEVIVLTMQEAQCGLGQYDRRDVFKCVMVLQRANELHYATRSYAIDRLALCVR